jgi:thymidylate synthase (FAD)
LKHESTLEHEKITFKVTTSRWVTHELVRHRLASYTQESTRYVKYWEKHWYKIIYPVHMSWKSDEEVQKWYDIQVKIAESYGEMLQSNWQPQEARWILPNDLKTDIVVTMNLRALRHYFNLRCDKSAHSDIRIIAWELMYILKDIIPLLFDDIV